MDKTNYLQFNFLKVYFINFHFFFLFSKIQDYLIYLLSEFIFFIKIWADFSNLVNWPFVLIFLYRSLSCTFVLFKNFGSYSFNIICHLARPNFKTPATRYVVSVSLHLLRLCEVLVVAVVFLLTLFFDGFLSSSSESSE